MILVTGATGTVGSEVVKHLTPGIDYRLRRSPYSHSIVPGGLDVTS